MKNKVLNKAIIYKPYITPLRTITMGKDLLVYYYPDEQIANQAHDSNRLNPYNKTESTPEAIEKDRLYRKAHKKRTEYDGDGARNLNLGGNDDFEGTYKELTKIIRELMKECVEQYNSDSDDSFDEYNYEAIGNLTKILKESPSKTSYIIITNG